MGLASAVSKLVPSMDGSRNMLRDSWDRLSRLPGGKRVFSALVGRAAPYTGSIDARIEALRPGYARVVMDDRRAVRNHLRSVHAVALVNLAELTANAALAYGLPDDGRFIVTGLEIEYLKKARGPITGECDCPVPESSERREYRVAVSMRDTAGDEVARATLRSLVGPKRG
jgi:acyl-coenzyme A thioesterase PaaI-like protein